MQQPPEQAIGAGALDRHRCKIADQRGRADHLHGLQIGRTADDLTGLNNFASAPRSSVVNDQFTVNIAAHDLLPHWLSVRHAFERIPTTEEARRDMVQEWARTESIPGPIKLNLTP